MGCPNWQLLPKQNWGIYRPEWAKRGTTWKWSLSIFKYKNECCKQLMQKKKKKKGVIRLVSMSPSWVMVLELPKKVHFYQFCTDLSKKHKFVKVICIHASESSDYTFSENVIWEVWVTVHEILLIKIQKKVLTQQIFIKILQL